MMKLYFQIEEYLQIRGSCQRERQGKVTGTISRWNSSQKRSRVGVWVGPVGPFWGQMKVSLGAVGGARESWPPPLRTLRSRDTLVSRDWPTCHRGLFWHFHGVFVGLVQYGPREDFSPSSLLQGSSLCLSVHEESVKHKLCC